VAICREGGLKTNSINILLLPGPSPLATVPTVPALAVAWCEFRKKQHSLPLRPGTVLSLPYLKSAKPRCGDGLYSAGKSPTPSCNAVCPSTCPPAVTPPGASEFSPAVFSFSPLQISLSPGRPATPTSTRTQGTGIPMCRKKNQALSGGAWHCNSCLGAQELAVQSLGVSDPSCIIW
jgi:hypothetical protein